MSEPELLKSPPLEQAGFRHAFFTRRGGVSAGPFASLNFSASVGDDPTKVAQNLEMAAQVLGVGANRVCYASQVHGPSVCVLEGTENHDSVLRIEADAVVSRAPELACGIRTADCVPILLGDSATGAAAAVHAGWRGVVRGVIEAAVTALLEKRPAGSLLAAIGPHISVRHFEVSEEVALELQGSSPDRDVIARDFGPKPHVNLRRIVHAKLLALGVLEAHIDHVQGCTFGEVERFYSYRRDGRVGGRHLSAIVPRPDAT